MLCSSTPIYTHSKEQSGPAASMALLRVSMMYGGKEKKNCKHGNEEKFVPAFLRTNLDGNKEKKVVGRRRSVYHLPSFACRSPSSESAPRKQVDQSSMMGENRSTTTTSQPSTATGLMPFIDSVGLPTESRATLCRAGWTTSGSLPSRFRSRAPWTHSATSVSW